jgi:hypothetical protein
LIRFIIIQSDELSSVHAFGEMELALLGRALQTPAGLCDPDLLDLPAGPLGP